MSLIMFWAFSACNSDGSKTTAENNGIDSTMDDMALHSAADMPGSDELIDYSYNYVEEVQPVVDNTATQAADKKAKAKATPAKVKVMDMPVIYTVSQTDRPPLFTTECATANDPQKCSSKALAKWARDAVKYPEADLADGSDGLEYVTFVINQNGKVSSINRLETKAEACEGCSKAVLDAVLEMPDWQPAMKDGKPVNVMVTLPVRFRTL